MSREDIRHQDVHLEVSPALSTWGPGIAYSRLLRFRSGPDVELPNLTVECELCATWSMEDERTFIFRLREGVLWPDTPPLGGRLLTSEDVVFSYNRQRQPGGPNAALFRSVRDLEAPNRETLRISLAFPDADLLISLADGHSKVVAREAVERNGDLKRGPTIGTGPWVYRLSQPGSFHVFESNPGYFEEGLPLAGKLVVHIIGDSDTRKSAFRVRAIDVDEVEAREWEQLRRQEAQVQSLMAKHPGTGLEVALKTSAHPFSDVRVRRAAFLAMDPWGAIREVWRDAAFVGLGVPPLNADWLLPEDELKQLFGDSQLARRLLQEAGPGRPVALSIKVGDFGEAYRAHAEQIAEEMRAVGFAPQLEVVSRRAFGEEVWLGGDYQMFVGPLAPVTGPNGYLLNVLHSQGQWNTAGLQDQELDRLIEAQAVEYDPGRRRELFFAIQRRALGSAYRFMPAARVSIWAWWPRVQDFHPNFSGSEYFHWARVWLRD